MKIREFIVLILITILIYTGVLFIVNLLGFSLIINITVSLLITINCAMWMMTLIDLSETNEEPSIVKSIEINHFKMLEEKGWDKSFWFFDLHSTVIKPNYAFSNITKDFYPHAKEVLQILSKRREVCLIMYTCSHQHEINEYLEYFKSQGINFEYVNENPEIKTDKTKYGCYDKKPYMNVLFEDKSGFDAENDWEYVKELLIEKGYDKASKEVFITRTDEEIKESRNSAKDYLI